jgi:hypothetical protein
VTTRPRKSEDRVAAALERIAAARRSLDDEGFATVDHTDPHQVYRYILRHPPRSEQIACSEVSDAFVLHLWLLWEAEADLKLLINRARRLRLGWTEIGSRLGLTRNAAKLAWDRLCAKLDGYRPDPSISWDRRRLQSESNTGDNSVTTWLQGHHDHITQVADDLVTHCAVYVDGDSWLHNVSEQLDLTKLDQTRSARTQVRWERLHILWMALTVDELNALPEVAELPPQHLVKRACRAVLRLRHALEHLEAPTAE